MKRQTTRKRRKRQLLGSVRRKIYCNFTKQEGSFLSNRPNHVSGCWPVPQPSRDGAQIPVLKFFFNFYSPLPESLSSEDPQLLAEEGSLLFLLSSRARILGQNRPSRMVSVKKLYSKCTPLILITFKRSYMILF